MHDDLLAPGAAELLEAIVRERMRAAPQGCVKLLGHVIERPRESDAEREAWFGTARKIGAACIDAVQADKADLSGGRSPHARSAKQAAVNAETLADLFECLTILESPSLRAATTAAIAADGTTFDACTTITPALRELRERGVAVMGDPEGERLWSCAPEALLVRAGEPPSPPTDWRQAVHIGCECEDCRDLRAFARHPDQQVHRFRVRKERQRHLELWVRRSRSRAGPQYRSCARPSGR